VAGTILYWASTVIVAAMSLFAGYVYLSGSAQATAGLTFAWVAAVVAYYVAGDGPTAFAPLFCWLCSSFPA